MEDFDFLFHGTHGGPHGADEEHDDAWTRIPESGERIPGIYPHGEGSVFQGAAGFASQEPYSPAMAHGMRGDFEPGPDLTPGPEPYAEDETFGLTPDEPPENEQIEETPEAGETGEAGQNEQDPAQASETDPLGSWTGVPDPDFNETPTQDADDL